ncbi:hypothetical protein AF335_07950 [Streptomyces eurocidicus]|uniref:DUF4232 domain-containing protein n=1 Tax=Streptomyces eurocidicus TaxID=66423 RepID=A0A2N8P0F9_STREU|nr:DUF4232 domain-containing protein [Streptomyces eurocidicus]MBB5121672.1 hypothetical protein [Streptomyces eurocidicus]MBF6052897.1 DUF4232 domain-containing protein [Streptomyces eurocidicus]PNE34498.1 hypothetical protein AF335_07950 [Streptomyces eurocidicus]
MSRNTLRGTATTAALAATVAATAVIGGGPAASAAPPTPTCQVKDLRAALSDKGGHQNGMSHEGTVLVLTNTSGRTCALRGYPGLQLEDAGHRALDTSTSWGSTYFVPDPGKSTLSLRPGGTAEAALAWAHADAPRLVRAAYLRVTPPASRDHLTIPFEKTVTEGRLSVTALAHSINVS